MSGATAMIEAARRIAEAAHAGQHRMDGVTPYVSHPIAVSEILADRGHPPAVVAAGLLHDVLEDGDAAIDWAGRIADEVGADVLTLVLWVTDPSLAARRDLRKAWTRQRVARAPEAARAVKLADVVHNLATLEAGSPFAERYLPEKEALVAAIGSADPVLAERARELIEEKRRGTV